MLIKRRVHIMRPHVPLVANVDPRDVQHLRRVCHECQSGRTSGTAPSASVTAADPNKAILRWSGTRRGSTMRRGCGTHRSAQIDRRFHPSLRHGERAFSDHLRRPSLRYLVVRLDGMRNLVLHAA